MCVVSLDTRPLEKVLGPELGDFIRAVHEGHGVTFRMVASLAAIGADAVTLSDGAQLPADLVIIGVASDRGLHWPKPRDWPRIAACS
jgi:apoptosis-inducing factor 3